MPDPITGVVGGSVVSGVLGSRSQKKAADKQADAIKDGQKISAEAAAKAREDVLASYAPAFKDIATGVQNARNDLLAGRITTNELLNNAFASSANTFRTSAQQAMQALVGPSGQTVQQGSQLRQAQGRAGQLIGDEMPSEVKGVPGSKSLLRDIRRQQADTGIRLPNADKKPSDYKGNNSYRRMMVDQDPYLSKDEKDKLKWRLSQQPEGSVDENFWVDYTEMTGGKAGTLQEARKVYENEQMLEGVTPSVTGGMDQLETAIGQDLTLAAPQGNYGLSAAEDELRRARRGQLRTFDQAAEGALSSLRKGSTTGRRDINRSSRQALGFLDPYREAGQGALDREAALTGALGAKAQAQAFKDYNESPGQKYLREQQEKALLRSSAAIGGLGGGNVRTALQEQAAGIASQNYQQDLENLRSLASRGQQAAGTSAGISQQQGAQLANIAQQLGMSESQVQQMLGQQKANVIGETGQQISGLRYGTGQDISRMLMGAGGQLSGMETQLGSQLGTIDQQTAANLSNLSAQYGQQISGLRTGLGSTLANIGVGQGSQQANLATQLGDAQAAGVTNPVGNIASKLTGLVAYKPSLFGF